MSSGGWIKLYRQILEWEYYDDVKCFKLWMHLLLRCNHESGKKAYGFTLEAGQLITTLPKLAAETGLSQKEVRTALDKLLSGRQIAQRTTNKFRLITVENWAFYQGADCATGRQTADKTEGTGQEKGMLKQRKEEIKNNNTILSIYNKPKIEFLASGESYVPYSELEDSKKEYWETWFFNCKLNEVSDLSDLEKLSNKLVGHWYSINAKDPDFDEMRGLRLELRGRWHRLKASESEAGLMQRQTKLEVI